MYLYNSSKNIIDLPSGETLYPGCLSTYISHLGNAAVQPLIRSGMVTVLQTQNIFDIVGYRTPLCYRGSITQSNEFPSRLLVRDGMVLTIDVDVSDINPEKTNTGKSFVAGQTIIWKNGDWWELPECVIVPDYYHWSATYSCSTFTWSVVLDSVDKIGPETAWSCINLDCTRTTLSSSVPVPPAITPVCPENLDVYDSCTESVDVYELCDTPGILVDVYVVCDDPVPPETLVDVYEICA